MAPLPAIREPSPSIPGMLAPDLEAAISYAKAEKSPGTRRAYETDHRLFVAWCEAKGVSAALPASAETVAAFLAAEADTGKRPSTVGRRLAAIRDFHKLAGLPTPTDAEAVKAIRGSCTQESTWNRPALLGGFPSQSPRRHRGRLAARDRRKAVKLTKIAQHCCANLENTLYSS